MSNYKELYDKWLNSPALTEEEKLQLKSVENDEVEKELERLALTEKKVVAIGEIGLDYHWMEDPKDVQIAGFRKQMELAERVKKPAL